MRRRKLLVALAGSAVVVAAGAVVVRPEPPDRVTMENFNRIDYGGDFLSGRLKKSSRAEVEAILGPPADYTTAPTETLALFVYVSNGQPAPGTPMSIWHGDQGSIRLAFDQQDKVAWGNFQGHIPVHVGALDLFLWRAKRQWRRWFP
jgi:hypothetical protein